VDSPESPDFSPDGKAIAFAAAQGIINDIYSINLDTKEIANLTKDEFADYAPTWAPDGKSIVHLKRVSGNEKLFRLDLTSGEDKQLTFGTHDEGGAQFIDADTLVFTSTATDPAKPIDPDVAKNGTIHNIWTLNMKTGELQQYTDALGGNYSPVVLRDNNGAPRIAFLAFYKGDYGLHTLDRREAIAKAATADFGAPGPVIDFQAPMTHTLVAENKKKKGKFEKMFLDGRPPVNLGVTSGGDFFGGTQISFTDVLGDQQFNMFAASVSQYRTMSLSYTNLERRFQYALQGYSQTQFFYGALEGLFYDPAFAGLIDRDYAVATRTVRGGTAFGIYPLNRYRRVEFYGGFQQYNEEYDDPALQYEATQYQMEQYGKTLFNNGNMMPLGVTFIQETTVFREFGPLAGSTMRINFEGAPNLGDATLSRQTIDVDARKYFRLGGSGLLALRGRGYKSWGENPGFYYFGGNSELRGYDYLSFLGNKGFFTNAELRFPVIEAALTPIGVVGGLRGVFFFNVGGAGYEGQAMTFSRNNAETVQPLLGYVFDPASESGASPVYGPPRTISGFRLVDARASYGFGLETFALGFPIHFDWAWRTLFNKDWEDYLFSYQGASEGMTGSKWLRKAKFSIWIGYDF
jgi:WD40-like Beta Propeller Repeat